MLGQTFPFDVTAIVSLELDALEVDLTRLVMSLFETLGGKQFRLSYKLVSESGMLSDNTVFIDAISGR
jgi:hypothetical protein